MMEDIYSRHEESTFMAMTVLLHRESLCPKGGTCEEYHLRALWLRIEMPKAAALHSLLFPHEILAP